MIALLYPYADINMKDATGDTPLAEVTREGMGGRERYQYVVACGNRQHCVSRGVLMEPFPVRSPAVAHPLIVYDTFPGCLLGRCHRLHK